MEVSWLWLNAYLGKTDELRLWKQFLPSTVVFHLSGELGMVPLTTAISIELMNLMPENTISSWGALSSKKSAVVYFSAAGLAKDWGTVWSQGREVFSGNLGDLLNHLIELEKIVFNPDDFNLEPEHAHLTKYQGPGVAEKWWADAAIIDRPFGSTEIRYFIKPHPNSIHAAIYRIYRYLEKAGRYGICSDFWDWNAKKWVGDEDIIRRYRIGFDADVDDVTEYEVIGQIQAGFLGTR